MDFVIRCAKERDLPGVVKLIGEDPLGASTEDTGRSLSAAYHEAFAAIDGNPDYDLMVMEHDGAIVGTLQLVYLVFVSFRGSHVALVESVHIDPSYQGRGLGSRLMHWAIAHATERGCHRMQLTSRKTRRRAHRFYEKLGFVSSHGA